MSLTIVRRANQRRILSRTAYPIDYPRECRWAEDVRGSTQALESGKPVEELLTVRTAELDTNPLPYDGPAVRATRKRVGMSQAVFAKVLGVSGVLVISWENGKRTPAPWACRLLDEVNRDPKHWRDMVRVRDAGDEPSR